MVAGLAVIPLPMNLIMCNQLFICILFVIFTSLLQKQQIYNRRHRTHLVVKLYKWKFKILWQKKKLFIMSNFYLCHFAYKSHLLQRHQKISVCGKGFIYQSWNGWGKDSYPYRYHYCRTVTPTGTIIVGQLPLQVPLLKDSNPYRYHYWRTVTPTGTGIVGQLPLQVPVL